MNRQLCFLALAFLIVSQGPAALAEDLRPPDYRFDQWSTVAGWDFLTEQEPGMIRPDADVPLWIGDAAGPLQEKFQVDGPYPSAALFGDVKYTPTLGGAYSGGSLRDGGIVFIVPNWLERLPRKRLRIIWGTSLRPP